MPYKTTTIADGREFKAKSMAVRVLISEGLTDDQIVEQLPSVSKQYIVGVHKYFLPKVGDIGKVPTKEQLIAAKSNKKKKETKSTHDIIASKKPSAPVRNAKGQFVKKSKVKK